MSVEFRGTALCPACGRPASYLRAVDGRWMCVRKDCGDLR